MKKIILTWVIIFLNGVEAYSNNSTDTTLIEKQGWLVYYFGHVIWFESNLSSKVKNQSFFTSGMVYQNGLIIDYLDTAKSFKQIAQCYSIKALTNIDTATKEGGYSFLENICVLPVKVGIKPKPTSEPIDMTGVSFKWKKNEVTIEYWFLTNYSIWEVELLRTKDKKKMKRLH